MSPVADELASSDSHEPGLGLRGVGDRRNRDRRRRPRVTANRRHGDRRRAGLRGVFFAAAAFALPHQITPKATSALASALSLPVLVPHVGVSIESFDPIPAAHAYDNLIR